MSPLLVVIGLLGMVPVFAVSLCGAVFGAGLPVMLVLGVYGRMTESPTRVSATVREGRGAARAVAG